MRVARSTSTTLTSRSAVKRLAFGGYGASLLEKNAVVKRVQNIPSSALVRANYPFFPSSHFALSEPHHRARAAIKMREESTLGHGLSSDGSFFPG